MTRWAWLALAFCACAQGEPVEADALDEHSSAHDKRSASEAPSQPAAVAGCAQVFSPTPELADAVASAAARWSRATGCSIRVGAGGIVVRTAPVLMNAETGETLLGGTHWNPIEVVVDADIGGETLQHTIDHEVGHALVGHAGHASSGLMSERAQRGELIDSPTLELVCSSLTCQWFAPED